MRCLQVNFYSVRFQTLRQFIMVFSFIFHLSLPHKPKVTLNSRDSPQVRTIIYDGEAASLGYNRSSCLKGEWLAPFCGLPCGINHETVINWTTAWPRLFVYASRPWPQFLPFNLKFHLSPEDDLGGSLASFILKSLFSAFQHCLSFCLVNLNEQLNLPFRESCPKNLSYELQR